MVLVAGPEQGTTSNENLNTPPTQQNPEQQQPFGMVVCWLVWVLFVFCFLLLFSFFGLSYQPRKPFFRELFSQSWFGWFFALLGNLVFRPILAWNLWDLLIFWPYLPALSYSLAGCDLHACFLCVFVWCF